MTTTIHKCRHCDSENLVKNGHNRSGSQQVWCKSCNKRYVLQPRRGYTDGQKEQIIAAYHERPSMRGIQRVFGVSPQTLAVWLKKKT
jgi:transposase-like protein